jgi:hypothetical protein
MSWCTLNQENESADINDIYGQMGEADGMIQMNNVCQGDDGKSGEGEEKGSTAQGGAGTHKESIGQDGKERYWRERIEECIKNPIAVKDRKACRQDLKYTMIDDELYQHMMEGLLLKCMNTEQARLAIGEVHEGLCVAHQLAHKMNWTLRRAGLYWLTMVDVCIRY